MKTLVVILVMLIVMLLFLSRVKKQHYEKLIGIQDEICYELLNDARERNEIMYAMQLISEEEFNRNKDKLISHIDKLVEGGKWGCFIHTKKQEEEHR